MATHLVWFRNDLRVTDNSALYHACLDPDAKVMAIYIATPQQWQAHHMSAYQAWFIKQHLHQLQRNLAELNIGLLYHEVNTFNDSIAVIESVCQQYGVSDLFYNKQYQCNEVQRDKSVLGLPAMTNINCHTFDDSVFFAPGCITTGSGQMYQIYTPFRNKFYDHLQSTVINVHRKPAKRVQPAEIEPSKLQPFSYPTKASEYAPIGEQQAIKRLQLFCREHVDRYLNLRDLPSLTATSQLSAYLAIGVLSVRQCFARLQLEHPDFMQRQSGGAFGWFNQLIWREFYLHLLYVYPKLSKNQPFIAWTKRVQWRHNDADFSAWQQGLTGYPIVDAAMRQLNQTGWMHNRLRMIAASFLVKDLLINWRQGEDYFMSQLIDGDLALNNGGWQWAASTGNDAAPYFRIFNPTTQSKRFDIDGKFIRQYLPELAEVPDDAIHEPHKWAKKSNISLNYPEPIVEHASARLYTLAAYNAAK
ncbi:deoxyribodipyrimidine photo-lyase [Orbus sturtevantii]|uniref:deoxyribodipyrimidine photo-lyase n=1 Tax=Orbus sturtevantii TaxID=3074109 RepID=UPI00370D776D